MSDLVHSIGPDQPFGMPPTPEEIARWWAKNARHYVPTCDGFNLWRNGMEYVYGWPSVTVDNDLQMHWLLDIRTHDADVTETRDFLYVSDGYDGLTWALQDKPIDFGAGVYAHRDRDHAGMIWLADKIDEHYEAWDARDLAEREARQSGRTGEPQ